MTLIKSVSGIRGTIGGLSGDALTPIDIVQLSCGYARWLLHRSDRPKIIIGRDGRVTGDSVLSIVSHTLRMAGVDVLDAGLNTTPSIEMAVKTRQLDGGIIVTASHNPMNWNALKLLNSKGEFLSVEDGEEMLAYADQSASMIWASTDNLGHIMQVNNVIADHIDSILQLDEVNVEDIAAAGLSVVVDAINSTGGIAIKALLEAMHVNHLIINENIDGEFAHNPEPLAAHLSELSRSVVATKADMGISVDPDVDRLALVCEDGQMFGEENTLIAVADYLLPLRRGPVVSNLSSSRGLRDVALKYDQPYFASPVGEVHVVTAMKEHSAVLGGEGNGGIILPDLHYGRDALVGIALFLSYYVQQNQPMSKLKSNLPQYVMAKMKISLRSDLSTDRILDSMYDRYVHHPGMNTADGIKIDFEEGWVHLRKSNTEPIIRVYSEAKTQETATALAERFVDEINSIIESL